MDKQTKKPLLSQTTSDQQRQAQPVQKKQIVKAISKPRPKFWEHLWKVLFLITTAVMLVLSNKIYLFHTLEQFKQVKKGQIAGLLSFGLPISVLYIALDYLIHFYFDQKVEKYYLRTDKYKQISVRKMKSRVIVRWGFNIFYYTVISTIGYFVIKNTSLMPPIFGGNGSIYTLIEHRYLDQATLGMQILYYIQFGKHVGRYFVHAFIQPQGSYYQYLLHHSLASFLIVFSYTMDMWVIGIFVCIAHDLSDAVLASCRMHRQYKNRQDFLLNINYVLLVVGWIGLRVFAFGYCCVWAIWYQYFTQMHILTNIQYQVFNLPYIFMVSMLTCLWFMHVYWTYYIVESFLGQSVTKKVQHSYD